MPTVMSHAAVAWGLARAVRPLADPALAAPREKACVVVAMLPDADVLAFGLGIAYEHPLGHRGLSHSLVGAAALAVAAWLLLRHAAPADGPRAGPLDLAALLLAAVSHGLLDMLTDGGLGIGLLIPFVDARYFAPVTPIPVSPIGLMAFLAWGFPVLAWELALLWPTAALGATLAADLPRRRRLALALAIAASMVAVWATRLHLISWDRGR